MGLLDGNLDPQSLATLQLAGGLLSPGSFGQGLQRGAAGYQGALASAQDLDIKKQALEMQKLQFAAAMRNQNLINSYLEQGIGGAQPAQPAQPSVMAGAGSMPDFMQNNPSLVPAPQGAPREAPFGGLPANQWVPDLAFNGGKGIADLVKAWNTPTSFRPGGWAKAPKGQWMQLPQAPEGYTATFGADGRPRLVKIEGGPEAVAAASQAKASGPAAYKQTEVIDPATGNKYTVFNKDLPGFQATPVQAAPAPAAAEAPAPPGVPFMALSPRSQKAVLADAEKNGSPDASITFNGETVPAGVQTGFAPGVEESAKNAQKVMMGSYETVKSQNGSAATVQARLENIRQLAQSAITGGNTEWRDYANNLAQIAGLSQRALDRKTAGDLIDKNAAQISLAIGTGTQGTDALRALAAAANPGRHMTPDAIDEAVAQLSASAQVQQSKAELLTPLFNSGNAKGYNSAEQAFDKNADYRLWQLANMTQEQAAAFRAKVGDKTWAALQQKLAALKGLKVF